MIFEDAIREWWNFCPWGEQRQVEQDLILHVMIKSIYSDPFLSSKLAFRGGTCFNKLYLKHPYRYSEDLDFVQIQAEKIGPVVDCLKEVLAKVLEGSPSTESSKGSFRLSYSFIPESSPFKQKIKIEINTREHFAIQGYTKKTIRVNSLWHSGEASVITFSFEELMATKLRALYQRRKGRDLFDLWVSQELRPDYKTVIDLFAEYMAREGRVISRQEFIDNLQQKMENPRFLEDIKPLVREGIDYDSRTAAKFVTEKILLLMP